MAGSFHRRYLTLVAEIERNFSVSDWKYGDVDIWPLARMDLYLDMHWAHAGASPRAPRPLPLRALARAATPISNLWRSRHDLGNWVIRPKPAYAVFLGDGVSLDFVDGRWRDRFGEPVIVELEKRGLDSFLMQSGELIRLPWRRPTFAANMIAVWGTLAASASRFHRNCRITARFWNYLREMACTRRPSAGTNCSAAQPWFTQPRQHSSGF